MIWYSGSFRLRQQTTAFYLCTCWNICRYYDGVCEIYWKCVYLIQEVWHFVTHGLHRVYSLHHWFAYNILKRCRPAILSYLTAQYIISKHNWMTKEHLNRVSIRNLVLLTSSLSTAGNYRLGHTQMGASRLQIHPCDRFIYYPYQYVVFLIQSSWWWELHKTGTSQCCLTRSFTWANLGCRFDLYPFYWFKRIWKHLSDHNIRAY